jgi:hypothetical protein
MAKESMIRKKAIELLAKNKWTHWFAPKVKFHETDIFGIADLICCRKNKIKFIQLTTLPNISFKRKKIINFFKKNKVKLPIEIWAWNSKKKKFKIEKIKEI